MPLPLLSCAFRPLPEIEDDPLPEIEDDFVAT